MDKKRFLIISGGNEGADTMLMLRSELAANYGSLEKAPMIMRYLAINTDEFADAQYPEHIRLKDIEKLRIDISDIQKIVNDSQNFGHLTEDLPTEYIVSESTKRGSSRTPSQGELSMRFYLTDFSKRLDLLMQQLFDPQVFPDPGELCVIIISSGCTGTGRGIHLEIAMETKRKLVASERNHRIASYVLSPEGLFPDDMIEKEKVFYAHLKELNAVASGEEYLRPFMADKNEQKRTGFPIDYLFLVSARSETVSLASLREVKQVVVNHLLYEITSTVGSRMESLRQDCRGRLRSKDKNGLPTFLSRIGIAAIDLPVRALKQLCLAQVGSDICETILGEDEENNESKAVLASLGLTRRKIEDELSKNLSIQQIQKTMSLIEEELEDSRPQNWIRIIETKRSNLEALLSTLQKGLDQKYNQLQKEAKRVLDENARRQISSIGSNTGVRYAIAYLESLLAELGSLGEKGGLIPSLAEDESSLQSDEKRENRISQCIKALAQSQSGLMKKVMHFLSFNLPNEERDCLLQAVKEYYIEKVTRLVLQKTIEFYRFLSEHAEELLKRIRDIANRLETVNKGFTEKLDTLKAARDFALAEYLLQKEEYTTLLKEHVSQSDLEASAHSVLRQVQQDPFNLAEMSTEALFWLIEKVITHEKRIDFIDQLEFANYFEKKFPSQNEKEEALRRAFMRAKPLTIVDANYSKGRNGVPAEARELVIVPEGTDESLIKLITKTYPVSEDNILQVSEKRLLVLREEHGFPVNAISYVKDECALKYKDQIDKARYHITKWASEYSDPLPMIATDDGQLTEGEILLLGIGLGVVQQKNDGDLLYLDTGIPIQLGQTFEEAVETIAQDGHGGEADRQALIRLIRKQEEMCISSQSLEKVFSETAQALPSFARSLRDVYQKRYNNTT